MLARQFTLVLTGLGLLAHVGCRSNNTDSKSTTPTEPIPVASTDATATSDPPVESPELIARRAQRYAAELEAIIAKRDAQDRAEREAREVKERDAKAHAVLTTAPSVVEWKDPPALVEPAPVVPAPVVVTPVVAPAPQAPVAPAPSVAVPNTGAVVTASVPAEPSTDAFEKALLTRIKENPRDAATQLDWQLLQFVRDKPAPDLATMSGLPAEDREVLSALVDGLTNYRAAVRNDTNMMLSKKVRPLIESAERLRAQAELHLSTVQLCTRVDGYGVYEPIDPARFVAGKEAQAVLYTEVANFASQLNDKSKWETKLTHEAVLYTETGLPVCQEKVQSITDQSRNRRTDFFVVRVIKLPASLTIGRYLLKVTVTDLQASRVAEATVPVTIVAR